MHRGNWPGASAVSADGIDGADTSPGEVESARAPQASDLEKRLGGCTRFVRAPSLRTLASASLLVLPISEWCGEKRSHGSDGRARESSSTVWRALPTLTRIRKPQRDCVFLAHEQGKSTFVDA